MTNKGITFLDEKGDSSFSNNILEYPFIIQLTNDIVKRLDLKYPDSRKCNSCGASAGWHVVERSIKNHLAADIRCNACSKVNGFVSATQLLRLQIVSSRLNGGVAQ